MKRKPKVTVEAERVSYRFTVKASGRPPRQFSGHSSEELSRDLKAAADYLGAAPGGGTERGT